MDLNKLVIPPAFAVGQLIDGRYRVVDHTPATEPEAVYPVIGFGGMGNVYRCEDQKLPRTVALKALSPTLLNKLSELEREAFVQRFVREFRVVAQLNHPCIMAAYDCGVVQTDEGAYPYHVGPFNPKSYPASWVVSELRAGRSPLTREETQGVLMDIAAGIHHIHEAGWILRDIKPPNIILEPDDALGAPRARLIDLGIAKKICDEEPTLVTQTGIVMGTDPYLPPEVIRGGRADERSDLWSFGITLYELLFGRRPFRATDPKVLHAMVQDSPPVWPCQMDDSIEALLGFDHIFRMLIEKDPADRCASAKVVYEALRDLDELPRYSGPNASAANGAENKDGTAAVHMMVMPSLQIRESVAGLKEPAPASNEPKAANTEGPPARPEPTPPDADDLCDQPEDDEQPERMPRKTKLTSLAAAAAMLVAVGWVVLSVASQPPKPVPTQISAQSVEPPRKPLDGPQLLAEEKQVRREQLLASAAVKPQSHSPSVVGPQPRATAQPTPAAPGAAVLASRQEQTEQPSRPRRKQRPTTKPKPATAPAKPRQTEEEQPLPNIMRSFSFVDSEEQTHDDTEAAKAPRPSRELCAAKLHLSWTSNSPNAPVIAKLTEDCGDIPKGSRLTCRGPSFRVQGTVAYMQITFSRLILPGKREGHPVQALAYEQDGTPGLTVPIRAHQDLYAAETRDTQLDIAEELSKLSPLRTPQRIIQEKRRDAARLRAEHVSVPLPKGRALQVLFVEEV